MTPDNETLYGWHLLPLHLCRQYEKELMEHPPNGPADDYTDTVAYKILANDPNARVVVSCKCRSHLYSLMSGSVKLACSPGQKDLQRTPNITFESSYHQILLGPIAAMLKQS